MSSPSDALSVTLLDVVEQRHTEILEWLLDNHIEYLCFISPANKFTYPHRIYPPLGSRGRMDCCFRFETVDHAMLFKLTWH